MRRLIQSRARDRRLGLGPPDCPWRLSAPDLLPGCPRRGLWVAHAAGSSLCFAVRIDVDLLDARRPRNEPRQGLSAISPFRGDCSKLRTHQQTHRIVAVSQFVASRLGLASAPGHVIATVVGVALIVIRSCLA